MVDKVNIYIVMKNVRGGDTFLWPFCPCIPILPIFPILGQNYGILILINDSVCPEQCAIRYILVDFNCDFVSIFSGKCCINSDRDFYVGIFQ